MIHSQTMQHMFVLGLLLIIATLCGAVGVYLHSVPFIGAGVAGWLFAIFRAGFLAYSPPPASEAFTSRADRFMGHVANMRFQVNDAIDAANTGHPIPPIDLLPSPFSPLSKEDALVRAINDLTEVLQQVLNDRR